MGSAATSMRAPASGVIFPNTAGARIKAICARLE
jgi:hypothetical protein